MVKWWLYFGTEWYLHTWYEAHARDAFPHPPPKKKTQGAVHTGRVYTIRTTCASVKEARVRSDLCLLARSLASSRLLTYDIPGSAPGSTSSWARGPMAKARAPFSYRPFRSSPSPAPRYLHVAVHTTKSGSEKEREGSGSGSRIKNSQE